MPYHIEQRAGRRGRADATETTIQSLTEVDPTEAMVRRETIPLKFLQIYGLFFIADAFILPQNKYYKLRIKITDVISTTNWWYMGCKICWRRLKVNENSTYQCPECTETTPCPRYSFHNLNTKQQNRQHSFNLSFSIFLHFPGTK